MKNALIFLFALALLSGCESVSDTMDSVRAKLGPRQETRVRVVAADQKATYEAALKAASELGYQFVRGGPAEGRLEELSPVSGDEDPGASRQIGLSVLLEPAPGGTQVTVSLREIIESDSSLQPGIATQSPLRDTPVFEIFFRNLQQDLGLPKNN